MTSNFVHLHVHSEYSLLDGLGNVVDLAAQAAKHKQSALALTDHGVMHGSVEFFRACKDHDVKPIIGVEGYLTPYGRKMTDRDPHRDRVRHHVLLLAQNMTGYQNLLKISSASQLEGYYYKPRIDADFLAAHSEGLICTSGCMAAEVPFLLNNEDNPADEALARERLRWYIDVFGRDRFYIELQEHSIPVLTQINKKLFEWAKPHDLELLVTNDVHYPSAEDAGSHDALLCIQTSALLNEQKRMKFSDTGYYLKSEEEMRATFRSMVDLPESAFTNSIKIAEMCEVDLEDNSYHLPDLPPGTMPLGYDYKSFLRHLTDEGLKRRYGSRANSQEVQARKELELGIISTMNFDVYFLIVWDLCEFARGENIWWNVRGSGAGSIVAYALGITLIDPLKNQLIFERFLNPGRVSMPDFDLDYPDDQRERLIRYTIDQYGNDHVAQIVSFGRMKARAAVRDVGRVQAIELDEVNKIAKLIPAIPGKPITIDKTLEEGNEFYSAELKQRYEQEPQVKALIDQARSLEGAARHASIHAAAVIVTDKPLVDYVPLMRPQGSVITKSVTQFEFPVCESIGLLKIDFLGLSTLTIMRQAAELIKKRHNIEYNLDNIPIEDKKAFDLLASGNVTGIFQVEGAGMRRILTDMRPSKFDHIIAVLALYRPGPLQYIPNYIARMHGKEEVTYRHPLLEPILEDTYGIIVYQEQIMRIATDLAGYTASEADIMRKAVAKKKEKDLLKHREKMVEGGKKQNISEEIILDIFSDIEAFARYGFPKGHAADYAVITCQTAYLKAHYPVEYMAALLTVEHSNTEKIGLLLEESRTLDINVLPPNVNQSNYGFIIEDNEGKPCIRFGLGAIKNVGEGPIEAILQGRGDKAFTDIDDFCQRVDLRSVGKRALESLIKAKALNDFADVAVLLSVQDQMLRLSGNDHQAASVGQMSLFDMGSFDSVQTNSILDPQPEVDEIPRREQLNWEKDLIGTYISEHPIQSHMAEIKAATTCLCGDLEALRHDRQVCVAGLITNVKTTTTKKGDMMAFVDIEDIHASLEIIVFPRTYAESKDMLQEGELILISGKVDGKDLEQPKVLANEISKELTTRRPVEAEETNGFYRAESLGDYFMEDEDETTMHDLPNNLNEAARASSNIPNGNGVHPSPSSESQSPVKLTASPPPLSSETPEDIPDTQSESPLVKPAQIKSVEINLQRTNNLNQDITCLHDIFDVLKKHPGQTGFYLVISKNGTRIPIEYPFGITYNPTLANELKALLGENSVRVLA